MTISAYWLLLALPAAFALGFFTAALCVMARHNDEAQTNSDRSNP